MGKDRVSILGTLAMLWSLLLISTFMLVFTLHYGPSFIEVLGFKLASFDLSLTLRFDSLSSPIFLMVSILGVAIGHYGIRYLDGDSRQSFFYKHMLGLIVFVSLLILANNLLMLAIMWMLTSYSLNKLLRYYPERPNALLAARKRQVITRLGDLCLIIAVVMAYTNLGSSDLQDLFATANQKMTSEMALTGTTIGILLSFAALTMSAQLPFHLWLPETMETPTLISALMHAGVINAGGFLIIRFSPLLDGNQIAHGVLLISGAFTAVYGSLVMVTQNNIKKKLAFSTISQMGIMIFACGLGAYGMALFHIIAHSFYKAHAFLSTGHLIEEAKKSGLKLKVPSPLLSGAAISVGFVIIYAGSIYQDGNYIALFTYGAIMMLSLAQNVFTAPSVVSTGKLLLAITTLMAAAIFAYAKLEEAMVIFLEGTVPSVVLTSEFILTQLSLVYLSFAMFAAGFWISGRLFDPRTPFWKRIYLHLWNAGYAGQISSRYLARFFPKDYSTNSPI
ncbi:proton-conducting transporter membrane subunit [Pseudobacteriovorax antillogorgiicola]|uniref:Probable inorganic carbon transporter subunit DabB n=2 Tax=Pseudobacteriovorax antillogorgiicola TaxID=1513793 RepID=A0A1Y6CBM4_9BACT|nr:proton-conducting transporter membrane subunit [Pseudobacteriovorax antillogorgiicola]TCS49424.1 NAD(P)H-quinone oxidoreductase subunit 5 [Pseudobacteriovorax antillogorgiicola]SMF46799.1 NAD(P)H-quinone oxidoreductase subunit 5 [Pseudobacteriovorax antillogorgiicola]